MWFADKTPSGQTALPKEQQPATPHASYDSDESRCDTRNQGAIVLQVLKRETTD